MRHQHAGLAVPDFPLAYGKVWPQTDAQFLDEVNRKRLDYRDFGPITENQIYLHMAHRLNAGLLLFGVIACTVLLRKGESTRRLSSFANGWVCLTLLQALFGAWTVWSNKAADIATAHVAIGALSLVWGSLMFIGSAPLVAVVKAPGTVQSTLPEGRPVLVS